MRFLATTVIGVLLAFMPAVNVHAQDAGDYRSAVNGDWDAAETWETFDGSAWSAAATAPSGTETISIADTVTVRGDVQVTGYVVVEGAGHLTVDADTGELTFGDNATYEHAVDGGSVPIATWEDGSTFLLTGSENDAPGNRNQSFHHITINTPNLARNRDLSLDNVTIGGNVHVISTGQQRWQLSSGGGGDTLRFSIMGDVIVDGGNFAVQGTGNAMTLFHVDHYGDLIVNGGNFSLARGSQGNGTGSTVWTMHAGDFTMSNAATQNSNPTPGNARVVFAAGGAQQLSFENVEYASSGFHFEVLENSELTISDGFIVNGLVVNRGAIQPVGDLTFVETGVYEHARDGGSVPLATWAEGSTARFTGITSNAPGNRGQDYFNLVLDTPNLSSNRDLSLSSNTISGDLVIESTGNARWQLVGGSDGDITILGDVIMRNGQFAPQGTSSPTDVAIHHYGDIEVTGGNFAIARGSQGGEGSTYWYLHGGSFSMSDATSQNSNQANAAFVFAGGEQTLDLEDINWGRLDFVVADSAIVTIAGDPVEGSGNFTVESGGMLTLSSGGMAALFGSSVNLDIDRGAGFHLAGDDALIIHEVILTDSIGVLSIANGVEASLNDTLYAMTLRLGEEAVLTLDSLGTLGVGSGEAHGSIVNAGDIHAHESITFGGTASFNHARDGGSIPSGNWEAGSHLLITGVVGSAPGNRNQSFHHITFNSPDQSSNLHMSFDGVTIGGDIRVLDTGSSRWYLTSGSAEDSTHVTLMGDVFVEGGQFSVHGTGNALTHFAVDHHGDIHVTGGNFSIARGSQGNGSGSTIWTLHGGDFRLIEGATQNSNETPGNAVFVFAGEGVQHLEIGADAEVNKLPIVVEPGVTLDLGAGELGGSDVFTLNEGATLATAHVDGVAGSIQTSGEVSLNTAANYVFNGTAAQTTSTAMPNVVNDLTIDNEAGVVLSQETTVVGVLYLTRGVFDNTIPFVLGENGRVEVGEGSLAVVVSTDQLAGLPTEFKLHQNFPNPFATAATIRYDVPRTTRVSITVYDMMGRRVMKVVDKEHAPGTYDAALEGRSLASGVYVYRIEADGFSQSRTFTLAR